MLSDFHLGFACTSPRSQAPRLVWSLWCSAAHLSTDHPVHNQLRCSGNSFPLSLGSPFPSRLSPPTGFLLILCASIFQTGAPQAVFDLHLNSRSPATTSASPISHSSQSDMSALSPPQGAFTPEEQERRRIQEARDDGIRRAMLVSPPLPTSTSVPQASTAARRL
jgi:hypothetical protein